MNPVPQQPARRRVLDVVSHPSVTASAATLVTLSACSSVDPVPVWMWVTSGALTVVALRQAIRK